MRTLALLLLLLVIYAIPGAIAFKKKIV